MVSGEPQSAAEGVVSGHGLDADVDPAPLCMALVVAVAAREGQDLPRQVEQVALPAVDVLGLCGGDVENLGVQPLVEPDKSAEAGEGRGADRVVLEVPPGERDRTNPVPPGAPGGPGPGTIERAGRIARGLRCLC